MNLHNDRENFLDLTAIVAEYKHIPKDAVIRDYYIVMMLQKLAESEYVHQCVFKGGTSLSKCYPNTIDRFSEDIDLTYLPAEDISDKQREKHITEIEKLLTDGFEIEKIEEERNKFNKSCWVYFPNEDRNRIKVKLEIGSSIRPDPYNMLPLKTLVQEYLEVKSSNEEIKKYGLCEIAVEALAIERTFIDKVMAVKRHAVCGTLANKVRHIYDVKKLFDYPKVQEFLQNKQELKRLISLTKQTDAFYFEKRKMSVPYNSMTPYDFASWKDLLDVKVKRNYESLHKTLLYTDEQQNLDDAIKVFTNISQLFAELGE